jgi:hypothetical protein
MATEQEVETFLKDFKVKMKIWDVVFRDDRGKNTQALADLELRPVERIKILENIKSVDYSEGPLEEKLYGGSKMWVFGKEVKQHEVYIKISIGFTNASVICISFHPAEHLMKYPFKKL